MRCLEGGWMWMWHRTGVVAEEEVAVAVEGGPWS